MPFSLPTMMIGADQNLENIDRLNLVILPISLHCIPTAVMFLGQNIKIARWRPKVVRSGVRGQAALAGAILTQSTI
jgi:hypothetical protein